MFKKIIVLPLSFSLLLGACSDDNTDEALETTYQATNLTCDGSPEALSASMSMTIIFTVNAVFMGLGGFSVGSGQACAGSYLLAPADFNDDDTFDYTRPAAANTCSDIEGESVVSCSVAGIACDTAASGPGISVSGTYTRDASQLVLTYTAGSSSFCDPGETEVLTLTAQ